MMRRSDQASDAGFAVPEEYAELADRVTRHLSAQSIDPAVRARHLHHLRELAAQQPSPRPVLGPIGFQWRGLGRRVAGTAAASLAAVTLTATAVAAASLNAVPGDTLYGTKMIVERVQLAAALTPSGDVAVLLDQAQRRVQEAQTLVERGADPKLVASALEAFGRQLREAKLIAAGQGLEQQVAAGAAVAAVQLGELESQMPAEGNSGSRRAVTQARQAAAASSEPEASTGQTAPSGTSGDTVEPGAAPPPSGSSGTSGSGTDTGTTTGDNPSGGGPADGGPPAAGDPSQPAPGGGQAGSGSPETSTGTYEDHGSESESESPPSDYQSGSEAPPEEVTESEVSHEDTSPSFQQHVSQPPPPEPETTTATSADHYGGVELPAFPY